MPYCCELKTATGATKVHGLAGRGSAGNPTCPGFSPGDRGSLLTGWGLRAEFAVEKTKIAAMGSFQQPLPGESRWNCVRKTSDKTDVSRREPMPTRYEDSMLNIAMRTVFVGNPTPQMTAILTRLGYKGFGSYTLDSLEEAREVMKSRKFEVAIALERLSDGQGYELIGVAEQSEGSLIVGVATSGGYLWLPVVDNGMNVHGARALDYDMLEQNSRRR